MKVHFLGTGTSTGVPMIACDCAVCLSKDQRDKRLRTSIWVEWDELSVVVDTGPDFRYQMLRAGVKRLDAVLFTHEHKDHIAGLDDVRAFNFAQQSSMQVFATKQVQSVLEKSYDYIFAEEKYPGAPIVDILNFDGEAFSVFGKTIVPIEVIHGRLPVSGFRFGDFTYITDAKTISDSEKAKIEGTKVLVLNAVHQKDHWSHLNLKEALDWVEELKPEQAYFTHISHKMGKQMEVQKLLPKGVDLAFDGLVIEC